MLLNYKAINLVTDTTTYKGDTVMSKRQRILAWCLYYGAVALLMLLCLFFGYTLAIQ